MLSIFNPATGAKVREIPVDTAESISRKFQALKAGQRPWAHASIERRIQILRHFGELVIENRESLAQTLCEEVGKPITQARNEVNGILPRLDFFVNHAAEVASERTVKTAVNKQATVREKITQDPLGVVAHISAWNYPYFVGCNVLIPALLTGNAVLYKPSEFATQCGLALVELLTTAGVPRNALATIVGTGETGSALLKEKLDGIFFTGSVSTGRKVAIAAAEGLYKAQLEMGGKDPVYVCEDVDVAAAAASLADGAFYNTGQSCCSVERIYVHKFIYEPFILAFEKVVRGFVVGDPKSETTYIGPLAREAQAKVLESQIKDARDKGARILCGGRRMIGAGYFFEPTVIADANHKMSLMKEESFGPIIGIQKVGSDEEAVELMNDTEYGLTAGVFSRDEQRALELLSQVQSGTAYWNCSDRVSPYLPWSGRRCSGLGCTLSTHGIQAFLQPRAWHLNPPTPT